MDSMPAKKADAVQASVAAALEDFRQQLQSAPTMLAEVYRRRLQEQVFTNRGVSSPGALGRIAADEVDMLLDYLAQPRTEMAQRHGAELCEMGLSIQSLLSLAEASRQFFLEHMRNNPIPPALQAIDSYHNALIHGFMDGRERFILIEQERLRSAYQKALGR